MPTNKRVATFASGTGSYTGPGPQVLVPTQTGSASATYNATIAVIAPYVSGILPGRSIGEKPYGAVYYGIIRAVYLTCTTTMSGTGAAGAGATATVRLYRAGASAVTVATLAFDTGTDATALTPKLIPVSATFTNVAVKFGDAIVFRWAQGGTGLTLPESNVQIDLI